MFHEHLPLVSHAGEAHEHKCAKNAAAMSFNMLERANVQYHTYVKHQDLRALPCP